MDIDTDIRKEATHAMGSARERMDQVREITDRAYHASEDFVRRYPLYSILGAVTLGAFLGGMLRRR